MNKALHSEDWLGLLFHGLDLVLNPQPYKYLKRFERWDDRNRLRAQLYQLQRAKLLERRGTGKQQTWSLTPLGRLAACGGVDPLQKWQRPWDGKWRLLLFDLPARSQQFRLRLWRWLHAQRFGLLQQSVWTTPDPVEESAVPLGSSRLTPKALVLVEGHPAPPFSDADLVNSAWDFDRINGLYRSVLELAARARELAHRVESQPIEFGQWLAAERLAWLEVVRVDPFLPASLLPSGYLGQQAWKERREAYAAVAERGLKEERE